MPNWRKSRIFMKKNIQSIIQAIKDYKGFETNLALANFLGVSNSTLSNWVARGRMDEQLILRRIPEIRQEFLATGQMPMTEQIDMVKVLMKKIEQLEKRIEELENGQD